MQNIALYFPGNMLTNPISDFKYNHSINKVMRPAQHIFDFYSGGGEKAGKLVCHKSESEIRPNYDGSVLAIDFLEVTDKNKGNGTKILKFAEEFSKQTGCEGFMTLKAYTAYTPEKIPHIFYRKFGFSTLDKKTDKKLDKFIKRNKFATQNDFPSLLMHYPPIPVKEKASKLNKIISYFKRFIKA